MSDWLRYVDAIQHWKDTMGKNGGDIYRSILEDESDVAAVQDETADDSETCDQPPGWDAPSKTCMRKWMNMGSRAGNQHLVDDLCVYTCIYT